MLALFEQYELDTMEIANRLNLHESVVVWILQKEREARREARKADHGLVLLHRKTRHRKKGRGGP